MASLTIMARAELSFSKSSGSRDRYERSPNSVYTDNLVIKNSLPVKGEEEILTLDTKLLKEGLWRKGCSQTTLQKCLSECRSHNGEAS